MADKWKALELRNGHRGRHVNLLYFENGHPGPIREEKGEPVFYLKTPRQKMQIGESPSPSSSPTAGGGKKSGFWTAPQGKFLTIPIGFARQSDRACYNRI
jgi:hypothetical protein